MKKIFEMLGMFFLSATSYQMMVNALAEQGCLEINQDGLRLK